MKITGFHHVALLTENYEKSVGFYEALGGRKIHSFNASSTGKEISLVELAKGAVVEIIQKPCECKEGAFAHIAIATDDCKALFDKAVSVGAVAKNAPAQMNLGTMPVINAFLYGPDGETIEIFQVL